MKLKMVRVKIRSVLLTSEMKFDDEKEEKFS